jgi:hypothetical protein
MVYETNIKTVVTAPIEKCFEIIKEVGNSVDKYKLIRESSSTNSIHWRKGMGWTSPITIRVDLVSLDSAKTEVTITAEVAAGIIDPFGFSSKVASEAIELFEHPFKNKISEMGFSEATNSTSNENVQTSSVADEIRKLAALKEEGIITGEEFSEQKRKLLE